MRVVRSGLIHGADRVGKSASPMPADTAELKTDRRQTLLPESMLDRISRSKAAIAPATPPEPPSPIGRSLEVLRLAGHRSLAGQEQAIETSFKEGYEALVRFQHAYDSVTSFQSPDEVSDYAALLSGDCADPSLAAHHQTLSLLEQKGSFFYFALPGGRLPALPLRQKEGWVRTDAAGAAILIRRGERIRHLAGDGRLEEIKQPAQLSEAVARLEQSPPHPLRLEAVQMMNRISSLGLSLEAKAEIPEDLLQTDYAGIYRREMGGLLRSAFEEVPVYSLPFQHRKMVDDLSTGGGVPFRKNGDYPFYPLHLNLDQLKTLETYKTAATPEMVTFDRAWRRLGEQQGLLFARVGDGEGKGALAKTDSLGAYLTLSNGGEVVALDGDGDLKSCTSVDEVLQLVFKDEQSLLADFRAMEKAGHTFWREGQTTAADPREVLDAFKNGVPVTMSHPKHGAVRTDRDTLGLTASALRSGAETKQASESARPIRSGDPKKNLFAVYYNALHDSEGKFPYYDDFPVRLQSLGSSEETDIVIQRSDRPVKRHFRMDYVHQGELEPLKTLPASQLMSAPEVFEEFVYQSVRTFENNEHIRLMVVGHGGADRGLMDDYRQDGAFTQMPVDRFAGAISAALDRIEDETGRRPIIDNLIMGSCLMGTASLVSALAERGDVRALSASPEVLLDGFPKEMVSHLQKHPDASAEEFARALVDINLSANSLEGGPANRKHALVYGAYNLDPRANRQFKAALKDFFQACTANPKYAAYYRQDIQRVPGYNIHPAGGPGIGENQRDLVSVIQAIRDDARINSKELKQAADRLLEAARAQVWAQDSIESYQGREGLSLHLPLRSQAEPPPTELLKDTGHQEFLDLLRRAPDRRKAHDLATDAIYRSRGEEQAELVGAIEPMDLEKETAHEQKWLKNQERPLPRTGVTAQASAAVRTGLKVGAALVGGAAGLAVGATLGGITGTALGLRAGFEGHSVHQTHRPSKGSASLPAARPVPTQAEATPAPPKTPNTEKSPPKTVLQVLLDNPRIGDPLLLAPMEFVGSELHDRIAYRAGVPLATLVAAPLGAVGGLVGGTLAGGLIGALSGGQMAVDGLEKLWPCAPPRPSLD